MAQLTLKRLAAPAKTVLNCSSGVVVAVVAGCNAAVPLMYYRVLASLVRGLVFGPLALLTNLYVS